MKTQLIITEKPSVAEKIAQALKETKIEKNKIREFLVKSDWKLEDLTALIRQHLV